MIRPRNRMASKHGETGGLTSVAYTAIGCLSFGGLPCDMLKTSLAGVRLGTSNPLFHGGFWWHEVPNQAAECMGGYWCLYVDLQCSIRQTGASVGWI